MGGWLDVVMEVGAKLAAVISAGALVLFAVVWGLAMYWGKKDADRERAEVRRKAEEEEEVHIMPYPYDGKG